MNGGNSVYLHSLRLWNWRKFNSKENEECGVEVEFNSGLNILVGENDAGKTAIIDAIKAVLNTNNQDTNWITEQDFYVGSKSLKIECTFRDLSEDEEAYFFEWMTFNPDNPELRVVVEAEIYEDINKQTKIKKVIKAGPNGLEKSLEETVKNLLSVTYLKPLRDATSELSPGKKSRIAQIVKNLSEFGEESDEQKKIIDGFKTAFDELKVILEEPVLKKVELTVDQFFDNNKKKFPEIRNKEMSFVEILRKLELNLGEIGTGLGSSNLLFMAIELLLLSEEAIGPKIAMIEEVEAHIHPQAQLRIIKHFEKNASETGIQYIFTSHSPILASSISLKSLIFIYNNQAFSMQPDYTRLLNDDYEFLERFLDATKANMFFAQGIIFVEGDAENLLLPAIAEVIDRPLHRYGVSIINVGNLAFKRYSSIFLRRETDKPMNFPVSIITDLDLKPIEFYTEKCYVKIDNRLNSVITRYYGNGEINSEFENTYITLNDVVKKSKKLYKSRITSVSSEEELEDKLKEIEGQIYELLKDEVPNFEAVLQSREEQLERNYFNGFEDTKVFISKPWTLEHSIAMSSLGGFFEDILLEINYSEESNREKQKMLWRQLEACSLRGTDVYKFLLAKELSKSIVAQKFAKYLLDNRDEIRDKIKTDENLKHLVAAIYHVTGGEQVGG